MTPSSKNHLFLLRGVPGCGKTSLAEFLINSIEGAEAYAADDYFTDQDSGKYDFDASLLPLAHSTCKLNVEEAMESQVPVIVVHNTSTTGKEIAPYLELAGKYNYQVTSLVIENRHGSSSIHGVPVEALERMEIRLRGSLRLRGENEQ